MTDKPIASLAIAPVVSSDATSAESVMAREAKRLQVQASQDSTFDTVLERFCGDRQTLTLSSLSVVLGLFLVSSLFQRRRKF